MATAPDDRTYSFYKRLVVRSSSSVIKLILLVKELQGRLLEHYM